VIKYGIKFIRANKLIKMRMSVMQKNIIAGTIERFIMNAS